MNSVVFVFLFRVRLCVWGALSIREMKRRKKTITMPTQWTVIWSTARTMSPLIGPQMTCQRMTSMPGTRTRPWWMPCYMHNLSPMMEINSLTLTCTVLQTPDHCSALFYNIVPWPTNCCHQSVLWIKIPKASERDRHTVKPLILATPNPKKLKCFSYHLAVVLPIQVLSQEWRCSWSSTDKRCFNYISVIIDKQFHCLLRCDHPWRCDLY